MTIAADLGTWAASVDVDHLPPGVLAAAPRHLLDAVGTGMGARRLRHAGPALTVARGLGGPPEARPLGDTEPISAPAAAFATGVLMHSLDFDDTHAAALVHPTTVVAPTVLAVAEEIGAGGARAVAALVIGLEIACRLGAAVPHGFHSRGLHATAVVGPPAAAAAAAFLFGASASTITDALGIATSSSGGLLEFLDTGANTKTLHPGNASTAGIMAARLARAGASGPASAFEGRRGLFRALADRDVEPAEVLDGLGERWECTAIGIKPYPDCQLMHATLDAVAQATSTRRIDPSTIRSIAVRVHPDSLDIVCGPGTGSRPPRSVYDAKFDLPWSVAALVHDGSVSVDTYSPESIARGEIAETASRVIVERAPDSVPAADAAGHAVLTLDDGSTLTGTVACSRGTAAAPMDDAAVRQKFLGNTGDSVEAAALASAVAGLRAADGVGELMRAATTLAATYHRLD